MQKGTTQRATLQLGYSDGHLHLTAIAPINLEVFEKMDLNGLIPEGITINIVEMANKRGNLKLVYQFNKVTIPQERLEITAQMMNDLVNLILDVYESLRRLKHAKVDIEGSIRGLEMAGPATDSQNG